MTTTNDLVQQLETIWQNDFPLNRSMGLTVVEYADLSIRTQAPLNGNTNIHGTAFAGSLYALQALSAWGLVWLALGENKLDGSIIHSHGNIDFAAPVTGDIQIQCAWPQGNDELAQLRSSGRCKFDLTTQVHQAQNTCSQFTGTYLIRLNK